MSDHIGAEGPEVAADAAPAQNHFQHEVHQSLTPPAVPQPDKPLPRPKRRRLRAKADLGLPPDEELHQLAAEYLGCQRRLWPEMAKNGLLPDVTEEVIASMVEAFKIRHRRGKVPSEPLQRFLKFCSKLAGSYSRFSCENSNPKSIMDQMVNGLEKAHQEGRFVPWDYVFADYSVSGLNLLRQGYSSYKALLQNKDHLIDTTYIDDFTRASRDESEWWRFAYLSRRLQKRLIGASDGFDLSNLNSDVIITINGLVSRLFIKGLTEKVKRGLRGAIRRGGSVGRTSLGFTRTVRRDEDGNIVLNKDGDPEYVLCIDPNTCDLRRLMYELFVVKCWSLYKITKHFNTLKLDDWDGWTDRGIRQLLWNPSAIGVFIWNRTRREYDREQEKWILLRNQRKDWIKQYYPELAIVPISLWAAARKKLAAMRRKSPTTGRKISRNQKSATTLTSGTLFCTCGNEVVLSRSTRKYKMLGCINGRTGAHGCELTTTKSARIVEKCILGYLQDRLLTEQNVEDLVTRANAFLAEEARKPCVDTAPLKASIHEKEAAIKKLFGRIASSKDEELAQAYEKDISERQKEVNQLRVQLRELEVNNKPVPAPLDLAAVKAMLSDMPGLLNQEIPAAAAAIRALTGPITITQVKVPGKRGATWIATFSPDLLGWLRQRAKEKNCPDSVTLEYLCTRIWITREAVTVPIEVTPKYVEMSSKVAELAAKGGSITTIAGALGLALPTAIQALTFAKTGLPAKAKPRGKPTGRGHQERKLVDAAEVVRLVEEQRLSFRQVALQLGVCTTTLVNAYDQANPQPVRDAAEHGHKPLRGWHSKIPLEMFERIRAAIIAGQNYELIAAEVGCGLTTVDRVLQKMGV
jgi:DNA invertase Pin-like site-specific DNA recombinase